jgi:hypothetical protein
VRIDRASLWEPRDSLLGEHVAELGKEALELIAAAVDVADDVERSVLVGTVVPQAGSADRRLVDPLRRVEHVDLPEPLLAHPSQAAMELAHLVADHMGPEVAIGTGSIALLAQALRKVEHDRYREEVVFAREPHELGAVLAPDVRSIDDRQPPAGHPLASDEMEDLESIVSGALVVLVVGHESPAAIRGQHLARKEMPRRGRRLPRA